MDGMLDHLGRVCLVARKHAGLRQIDIATRADVSHATIGRFETPGAGSPRDVDAIVDAYAHECGVDAFDLWTDALHTWKAEKDG